MKRQVFFSFEYMKDGWRAAQIRNMGSVSENSTFSDNDWEEVKYKSDSEIKNWIDRQMTMRSCIVVLVGTTTSLRKWVKYEIQKAYELDKGIVGIYIHCLKDKNGNQAEKGSNPFHMVYTNGGERLSKYVECYESPYRQSNNVYSDIENRIASLIEKALEKRAPR